MQRALQHAGMQQQDISNWCIHPGGRRIVDTIHKALQLPEGKLQACYDVLRDYGNMSSPTILFVLKELMHEKFSSPIGGGREGAIFGAAFGPGLTMETFVAIGG